MSSLSSFPDSFSLSLRPSAVQFLIIASCFPNTISFSSSEVPCRLAEASLGLSLLGLLCARSGTFSEPHLSHTTLVLVVSKHPPFTTVTPFTLVVCHLFLSSSALHSRGIAPKSAWKTISSLVGFLTAAYKPRIERSCCIYCSLISSPSCSRSSMMRHAPSWVTAGSSSSSLSSRKRLASGCTVGSLLLFQHPRYVTRLFR